MNAGMHNITRLIPISLLGGLGMRLHNLGMRLHNLGMRLHNLGMRLRDLGMRLHNLGMRLHNLGMRLHNLPSFPVPLFLVPRLSPCPSYFLLRQGESLGTRLHSPIFPASGFFDSNSPLASVNNDHKLKVGRAWEHRLPHSLDYVWIQGWEIGCVGEADRAQSLMRLHHTQEVI